MKAIPIVVGVSSQNIDRPGTQGEVPNRPRHRRSQSLLVLAAVLVAFFGFSVQDGSCQPAPTKRALLIGIDEYKAAPRVSNLSGCVNDVELMKAILVGKFDVPEPNIKILRNEEATRANILEAIQEHLIKLAGAEDVVILHYSGHGSRMRDHSGDEIDQWDETIVPHDSRTGSVFDINDDEINALMKMISEKTPNVTFILDSCHSGSAARAVETGNVARITPPDLRDPPVPMPFTANVRGLVEGVDDFRLPGANYVLISGCRANELSNEGEMGGKRHGALTYFLARALRSADPNTTYRDILDSVQTDVSSRYPAQHPQLEGTGSDTVIFGDRKILPRPFVLVDPVVGESREVTIGAGDILGLTSESLLDVYPPATKLFDDPAQISAQVRVTQVESFESKAMIERGGSVMEHSRAVLDVVRPPDFQVGVHLAEVERSVLLKEVAETLTLFDVVKLTGSRAEAQIRVELVDATAVISGRDLEILGSVALCDGEAKKKIVERVTHWARWYSILAIANPSPSVEIGLQVSRSTDKATPEDRGPETITAGTEVMISVENRSQQDLYVIILDLASDGSINVLHPRANIAESLPQGRTLAKRIGSNIPADRDVAIDVVKVIATTQEISPTIFKQGPVPRTVGQPMPANLEDPLEGFLRRSVQGLTRNLSAVEVDGWVTRQTSLRVVRPSVDATSFALHFDDRATADRASELLTATGSRAICSSPEDSGCFEVETIPGDPTFVEIHTPRTRAGKTTLVSVGAAFDEAYDYRDSTGASRAEPLFDVVLPRSQTAPHPDLPEARGSGGEKHDQRAKDDPLWSLKHARVLDAWVHIQGDSGRPHGSEADGVVIAHPDTGYRPHPEIWGQPTVRPAWPEMGYDYYSGDGDPTDDLLDGKILDHPGHGTGSGSAIVSPIGCQAGDLTTCPTGPALGARLVPLRVHRSVVHFNTKRLAKAIRDASSDDRSRVGVETDVMSISMGGVPSWTLWKAVKKAEERGYLVIAASGNYVRIVVWPARFKSVVSVAATNVGCRPWAHSSRGRAIDFSAPGESVWRAELIDDGSYGNGMGTGTTYATATTAGVAALWVAQHRDSPEFEALKERGELTRTFRQLVQQTSWRPGTPGVPTGVACDEGAGWNSSLFGSGIIDAAALLEQPLPTVSGSRAIRSANLEDLPLWRTLFPEDSDPAGAVQVYRRLFRLDPQADLEEVAVFEAEITYHYSMSEAVAAAVDEVANGSSADERAYSRIRQSLLAQDLSGRLRAALR